MQSGQIDDQIASTGGQTVSFEVEAYASAKADLGGPSQYAKAYLSVEVQVLPIDFKLSLVAKNYKGSEYATVIGSAVVLDPGAFPYADVTYTVPADAGVYADYEVSDTLGRVTPFDPSLPLTNRIYFSKPGTYVMECHFKNGNGKIDKTVSKAITVYGPTYTLAPDPKPGRPKTGVNDISELDTYGYKNTPDVFFGLKPNLGGGKRLYLTVYDDPIVETMFPSIETPASPSGKAMIVQTANLHYETQYTTGPAVDPDLQNDVDGLDGYAPYGKDVTSSSPGLIISTRPVGGQTSVLEFRDTPAIPLNPRVAPLNPNNLARHTILRGKLKGTFYINILYKPVDDSRGRYSPFLVQKWGCDGRVDFIGPNSIHPGDWLGQPITPSFQDPLTVASAHPVWKTQVNK